MATIRLRFRQRDAVRQVRQTVRTNMLAAAVFYRDRVKEKLNVGQPVRTLPGGGIVGLNPSDPGEPPRKITGQLQASIFADVREGPNEIIGVVGSPLVKAAPLEFGTRDGRLKPRPFFRPALIENQRRIIRIIARGF